MKLFLCACLVLVLVPSAQAAEIDYSNVPTEQLIDELLLIEEEAPGLHGTASVGGFIAEDKPLTFEGGVLGSVEPVVMPQMRELVRRGAGALPLLLQHLDDERPTRLTVGGGLGNGQGGFFTFQYFSDQYESRFGPSRMRYQGGSIEKDLPDDTYVIKVGDVCFALIGQIVNRRLETLRYRPMAGLTINSPIEIPELAEYIRQDWEGVDATAHQASLISDLDTGAELDDFGSALVRLQFYYPDAYAALQADRRRKREEFEFAEIREAKRNAIPYTDNPPRRPALEVELAGCSSLEICTDLMNAVVEDLEFEKGRDDYAKVAGILEVYGEPAKQELLRRATGIDSEWRWLAGLILAEWSSLAEEDVPQLVEALRLQPSSFVGDALARIGSSAAIRALTENIRIIGGGAGPAKALVDVGSKAMPYLLPLLEEEYVWEDVAELIGRMGGDATPVAPEWAAIAVDTARPQDLRVAALRGLAAMGSLIRDLQGSLSPLLGDSSVVIRTEAERALQAIVAVPG